MVHRGRSVVTSGYSCRSRASSVPGVQIDDGFGISIEPSVHRVSTVSGPRIRHEHIDLSSARQPDSKFYNDVNARLASLGPEPLLVTPHHSSALYASPHFSSVSSHHSVPLRTYHHSPEVVVRRRTATTTSAAPVVHRRSDFDAEVAAYLSYTPQHHYTHRSPTLRSSSVNPASSFTSSLSPFSHSTSRLSHAIPSTHSRSFSSYALPSHTTHSFSSHTTPSYISQYQHNPFLPSVTHNLETAPSTHLTIHSSTLPFEESFHDLPVRSAVRTTYAAAPPRNLHYDYSYVPDHLEDLQFTTEQHTVTRDLPQRSLSRFSRASAYDSYCHAPVSRLPHFRAASVDPGRLNNFKEVKPPISETRRKVRDLICKTRNDQNYYK